jgi:sulfoxide reductase catalytic subunit YedY
VTTYNNYYEFGTDKNQPAKNAQKFITSPWTISVEGECAKPRKFTMDEIVKLAPLEERIYRHRCVEGWSIVVPWIGYSFSTLAKLVEPNANAKFVAFESYFDKKQMPLVGPCWDSAPLRRRAPNRRGPASAGTAVRRHVR